MQDALMKVGGFGLLQIFSSFVLIWSFNTTGYNSFALPFYELMPEYLCMYINDPEVKHCTREQIDDHKVVWHQIDWDSPYSLHNWVEQMHLENDKNFYIGMIGSAYFLGWVIALFFVPRLGDIYGRKYPLFFCMAL